jgi:hypothetical protein
MPEMKSLHASWAGTRKSVRMYTGKGKGWMGKGLTEAVAASRRLPARHALRWRRASALVKNM